MLKSSVQPLSTTPARAHTAGPGLLLGTSTNVRRTLPNRVAYQLAAALIGLGLFASLTPSPLYHTYVELWHFSPLTLTLVYAVYAFGVLASLLVAGRVSDEVGRRPVLLVALGMLLAATVLFMFADSASWLFAARALQGVATGAALSTASAALLDLHPRHDAAGVGLTNAVSAASGIGLGMLVSSSLVQLGRFPRVVPYLALFVLIAIALAGVYWMPEPGAAQGHFRLTAERPTVPAGVRRPFLMASLAVISSWSIGALFFSLGPELSARLFATSNAIVAGIGVVALAGSAGAATLAFARSTPWIAASGGSLALAIGMILIVLAAATGSVACYVAGSLVGGAGFGLAYLGGLRALVAAIPNEQRATVMSAFYVVAYASLSIPAIIAGVLVGHLGLPSTFELFGTIVSAIAVIVAFDAWRTRPSRPGVSHEFGRAPTSNDEPRLRPTTEQNATT